MNQTKKIIITGATGLIGSHLAKHLTVKGYSVISFSRDAANSGQKLPFIAGHTEWNPAGENKDWFNQLSGAAAVINLAGASIGDKKWSDDYKKVILTSRIESTNAIVDAISAISDPPMLINASAIGYYGDRQDETLTENSAPGSGFLAQVAIEWEKAANRASEYTQVAFARTGIVLAREGGTLGKLFTPFKLFAGGPLGSGRQFWSWIHIDDVSGLFEFIIENKISGPVNFVSPNPLRMTEFAKTLGKVMHRPSYFKVPAAVLRMLLGESADLVLDSQRVIPAKATDNGFRFNYPKLKTALEFIIN